jgi:hypothetical protein
MSFYPGTPNLGISKFSKLGLMQLWRPIHFCADLWLKWGLKQSCSPHRQLSNSMWHATFTQGNQGDFWLLMVRSQTANLTPSPSFGHNLCFDHSNGSCEPIFDIFVPRSFQWNKELHKPMGFDPCNRSLRNWKSARTPTPKVGAHLGVWGFIPSHFPTLLGTWNVTLGLPFWPTPLQTLALVMSPRLELQQGKHFIDANLERSKAWK